MMGMLAYFTPEILRGILIGGLALSLFGAGWSCKGKQCAKKIDKKNYEISVLNQNYDGALQDIETQRLNEEKLTAALKAQNEAYIKANEEHAQHVATINAKHEEASAIVAESYQRRLNEARAKTEELEARVRLMSAAETCHEVMKEIASEETP